MRKITFISLFIALFASVSMQAQENAYNMVIEMNNGTKITIGPNDVKNITFNDGELVVTGPTLQEWMETMQAQTAMLAQRTTNAEQAIDQVRANIETKANMADVQTMKANMEAEIAALQAYLVDVKTGMEQLRVEYYSFIDRLGDYVGGSYTNPVGVAENLNTTLEDLKQRIQALESRGVNKPAAQAGQSPE